MYGTYLRKRTRRSCLDVCIHKSGTVGDTPVDTEVELEEVQPADAVDFPSAASTESTQQNVAVGTADWLVWLSLLLGLLGVGLGAIALRQRR